MRRCTQISRTSRDEYKPYSNAKKYLPRYTYICPQKLLEIESNLTVDD